MMIGKTASWRSLRNLHSYTKLLIHSNTTDGSTTFTDSSDSAHSPYAVNNAQHDTAQAKFGTSSILFDSISTVFVPDSSDFNFGDGPFTIDFWARFSGIAADRALFGQVISGTSYYSLYWTTSNVLTFKSVNGGDSLTVGKSWSPSIDTWYHIAVVREGNVFTLYVNGQSIGSETQAFTMPDVANDLRIGEGYSGSLLFMYGWIDEFRIVKGKAMWVSNFVPAKGSYG